MSEAEQRLRRHVLDLQTKLQARDQQLAALREGIERLREAWTHEHWDKVVVAREALFALLALPAIEGGAGECNYRTHGTAAGCATCGIPGTEE